MGALGLGEMKEIIIPWRHQRVERREELSRRKQGDDEKEKARKKRLLGDGDIVEEEEEEEEEKGKREEKAEKAIKQDDPREAVWGNWDMEFRNQTDIVENSVTWDKNDTEKEKERSASDGKARLAGNHSGYARYG